jgi:hypothetical protein
MMKFRILAATAMVAASAATAPTMSLAQAESPAMELNQLQNKAEAFVSTVSTQTSIGDVQGTLGTNQGTVDQPCGTVCSRIFQVAGGKSLPFSATLFQYSRSQNINTYHFDRPFVPEEVLFELDVAGNPDSTVCFSEPSWNAALTQAGWEPLRPYDTTIPVKVTDDKDAFDRNDEAAAHVVDVPVHGFATRRGDRYLTLTPIAGSFWNTELLLGADLQSAEAMGNCLRIVITDRHVAKKGYELSVGAKPAA